MQRQNLKDLQVTLELVSGFFWYILRYLLHKMLCVCVCVHTYTCICQMGMVVYTVHCKSMVFWMT